MDFSYSLTTTVWVLDEANLFIKKLKVVTRNASFQDYNYLFNHFQKMVQNQKLWKARLIMDSRPVMRLKKWRLTLCR